MRADDAREAARLGAAYVGAIFAGGPRTVTSAQARELFAAAADGRVPSAYSAQTT